MDIMNSSAVQNQLLLGCMKSPYTGMWTLLRWGVFNHEFGGAASGALYGCIEADHSKGVIIWKDCVGVDECERWYQAVALASGIEDYPGGVIKEPTYEPTQEVPEEPTWEETQESTYEYTYEDTYEGR